MANINLGSNSDYEIEILTENYRGEIVALARNRQAALQWVTWEGQRQKDDHINFFWGHYFSDSTVAKKDYFARIQQVL